MTAAPTNSTHARCAVSRAFEPWGSSTDGIRLQPQFASANAPESSMRAIERSFTRCMLASRGEERRHVARIALGHAEIGHRRPGCVALRCAQPLDHRFTRIRKPSRNVLAAADAVERGPDRMLGADYARDYVAGNACVLLQR